MWKILQPLHGWTKGLSSVCLRVVPLVCQWFLKCTGCKEDDEQELTHSHEDEPRTFPRPSLGSGLGVCALSPTGNIQTSLPI